MNDCKPIDIYCLDYIFNDKATPLRTFICINFGKTDGQGKRVLMEETWTICKLLNEKGRRGGTDVTRTSAQSVPIPCIARNLELYFEDEDRRRKLLF